MRQLKKNLWITAAVNSIALEELKLLGQAFSQPPPIPAVVLKGGALAFALYPDLALRPLSDIDILVPEERLEEAIARIKALGYRELSPEITPNHRRIAGIHCSFVREKVPLTLELHWSLVAGKHSLYAPDMAWFWSHTEPLPSLTPLLTLEPTAHLLYLAVHAMFDHGEAELDLKWLYDIHMLVEKEGVRINWKEMAEQAIAFRWADALLRAFERCSQLFGTHFPQEAFLLLERGKDEATAKLLEFKASSHRKGEKTWENFKLLDWRGKLSLLRALFFPSPAFVRWRYRPRPLWIWPFFYIYRWLDIMKEGVYILMRKGKGVFFILLGFTLGIILAWLLWPPRVIISWETASEVDTLGFFLYRAEFPDGPFVQINETPLLATGDPLVGSSYSYEDRQVAWGKVYFYQLEELERSGNRNRYPMVVKGQAGVGWAGALAIGALTGALAWSLTLWGKANHP